MNKTVNNISMLKEFGVFKGFKVLEYFLLNPMEKASIRGLARKLKVSTLTSKNYCDLLERSGFLLSQRIGIAKLFWLRNDNSVAKRWKSAYMLQYLSEMGLEKAINNPFYIYGSIARGDYSGNSDIDIFVECKKKELNLEKLEKKLRRKIELHFNERFISYPKELKNNIINGIVLSGFLEGY